MPYSTESYKEEVCRHITAIVESDAKLLDVGPGVGRYGTELKHLYVDAVEIYEPYIERFGLRQIYKNIHCNDILSFDWNSYDYIILGDVLEHIELTKAQKLISDITQSSKKCLVAVPYMFEQGEWDGNIYETHLQPDLTPENMLTRYPELKFLIGEPGYGYYTNY